MRLKVASTSASTQMLFTVARIQATNGDDCAVGTAFFFSCDTAQRPFECLVTNKHVIEGAEVVSFHLHGAASGMHANLGKQTLITSKASAWIGHPDSRIDLCCLPVSAFLPKELRPSVFYLPILATSIPSQQDLEEWPASIGVAMIGYPIGLSDEKHGLPIIRHGVTASHPAVPFNGNDEVVVDIACFPGSSGSPVLFDEQHYFASAQKFLGVLYAGPTITIEGKVQVSTIPTTRSETARVDAMIHLGYVISAKKVHELAEHARA